MTIRPATAADVAEILHIEHESGGASHWDEQDYARYECEVADTGSGLAGFILFRQVADTEFEILNVAVRPEFRGRGIGRELLQAQLTRCKGHWFLEVRRSNSAARNLYKRLGFHEVGERPNYYSNPSESAIVMSIRSC